MSDAPTPKFLTLASDEIDYVAALKAGGVDAYQAEIFGEKQILVAEAQFAQACLLLADAGGKVPASATDEKEADDDIAPAVKLPEWFPAWAKELADLYFSGSTCVFVLHGNVHDLVRCVDEDGNDRYCSVVEFLSDYMFGSWNTVLRHDLSNGLRALAGSDRDRLREMMEYLTNLMGPHSTWSRSVDDILLTLNQLIERNLIEDDANKRRSMALVFEYAQYLVPTGDVGSLASRQGSRLVRFLQWAQNPYIKRRNICFAMIADKLSEVNDRLTQSPHVATIEITMPKLEDRQAFIEYTTKEDGLDSITDFSALQLAGMSNGLSITSVNQLLSRATQSKSRIDGKRFRRLKKGAIERQCQGLLEFVEPQHTLDLVVGHVAAKKRLREDAEFIMSNRLDAAPMGYLLCGPVGTGKTFLAECYAGSIGIPCVKLRNFRSKYVGESEGNLEKVLNVLRSLGPVIVIIDEADAALGDRTSDGDSGTSGRIFSMIASQMGDTAYRGKIIWMLLTCRPDLLPIDIKRQGRAEVHIPLFYPRDEEESEQMFVVMARKNKIKLAEDALKGFDLNRNLSGADIEGIVLNAKRTALADGRQELTAKDIGDALDTFIPSSEGLEKEMQEIAGVLECTQRDFLPDAWRDKSIEDRGALQNRLVDLRALID
jgi:AAA+ superfamily predicted ATPase